MALQWLSDNISVDKSKCVFCMECVDKCILDNLRFKASPCREACPLHLNCQGYVQMILRRQEQRALEIICGNVPFPRILGRVCAAPCETACFRRTVDGEAVAIRALKRYVADTADAGGADRSDPDSQKLLDVWKPASELPDRVAVLGGGPAGIMASCHLRRQGYRVTVFDAAPRLGGMLTNCIPEFRLPAEVAAEELSVLERLGIDLRLGVFVDASGFSDLRKEYGALLVATGATRGKHLGIPGEDLLGVYQGVEFLSSVRSGGARQAVLGTPRVGRRVVVIGGGNTAVDCAQTAYRLGAEEVQVVCLESREEMPAFPGAVRDTLEEGIVIQNGWGPARILSTEGRVSGVECKRCLTVFDGEGRFAPRFEEHDRRVLLADTVIVAIGQEADLSFLAGSGVETHGGLVVVDAVTLQTSVHNVFAAGDCVTGPSSVVEAMAQGRAAAESVHRFLRGEPMRYGRDCAAAAQEEAEVDTSATVVRPRVEIPRLPVQARRSFGEIEGTLRREQAVAEAERCLSCGEPFGKHRTCWSCLACEVECPEHAITIGVPYLMS
ncbi:MAG: FAD-dependent oxidoreductase [Bacillota bacterium]